MKCTIFLYGVVLWAAIFAHFDVINFLEKLSFFLGLI